VNDSLYWNLLLSFIVSILSHLLLEESPSLFGAELKEEDLFKPVSSKGSLVSLKNGTSVLSNAPQMATLKH
jgi:hypothetical protein